MNTITTILKETDWLYTRLFETDFFFIDLWSVVNLWSGFSLFILLCALKVKRPYLILLLILIAFEIIEILVLHFALSIFRTETFKNEGTHIYIGMAGGLLALLLLRISGKHLQSHRNTTEILLASYTSFTYAFVWVGFYGYRYNLPECNSNGINYTAFIFWFLGLTGILLVFSLLKKRGIFRALFITWGLYLVSLFSIEYYFYYHVGLHENSKPQAKALFFGIIHGLPVLHIVYLFAPLIIIIFYLFFRHVLLKALAEPGSQPKTQPNNLRGVQSLVKSVFR